MSSKITQKQIQEITQFLNQNLSHVPGTQHFIERLKNRKSEDDLIHAQIIKRIHESGKFKVTGIDLSIDIYNKKSYGGGVPTNFVNDIKKIDKKIKQLSNNKLGIVICYPRYGLGIDAFPTTIPKNKAFVEIILTKVEDRVVELATIFVSNEFDYEDVVKEIVKSAGFTVREQLIITSQKEKTTPT
ncbi:MAG: hypothetical protein QMD80_02795 [archaeon]|nr:hypothetical protein [archaeon]MDI6886557.1 hypothetical protein [archaeon]